MTAINTNSKDVPKRIIEAIKACESGKYTQDDLRLVQLIQAAPELLEVAKFVLEKIDNTNEVLMFLPVVSDSRMLTLAISDKLQRAIDKAEGR